MFTILQDSSNNLKLPFKGNYNFLLISFKYRNKTVDAIFENTAGIGCDYEINIIEVGETGTVGLRNGRLKLSPRGTWKATIYGQDNNTNLSINNAVKLHEYDFQVKGESCKVYPVVSNTCPDSNLIVNGQGGVIVNQDIQSGASFNLCIVNSLGQSVGLVGSVTAPASNLEANLEIQL